MVKINDEKNKKRLKANSNEKNYSSSSQSFLFSVMFLLQKTYLLPRAFKAKQLKVFFLALVK